MLSKMRGKKPSGAVSERGSGAALVQTAMNFPEQRLRAEWLLANPGAQEEKFEPWLHDGAGSGAVSERGSGAGGAGRRELMNSYNMQRLPPEPFVSKQGFFIKANQAQNSWKRRFFVVRAGMLVFFKDDPAKQPPGVATIPQGAVPLQGCEAAMPMDFARSFSTKPRKGVTGFELKLTHSSRRPFLFVFPTAAMRLEWCNYLSHYILHSFLPEEFTNAAKIHEVEMFPLYCIHEACSKEGEEEHSNTDSSRTSSKKYLYLDWFSPDSAEWCLRLSSMKLRPAKQADGKEGFDTTMQSLSTSLLLHRISRVDLEGHPLSSPLRRATSPPIQQTETTDLPRKPTFDVSEQDQYHDQEELVGPGRNGLIPPGVARNPVLVLHECLPAASSAYSSLLGAVADTRCHRFYPVDGNADATRQWHSAIRAALQLQDINVTSQVQQQVQLQQQTISPRPGLFGLVGRTMSSKSVNEVQEQRMQNLDRGGVDDNEPQIIDSAQYTRAEFLCDANALDVTQKSIDTLSIAAESYSEIEADHETGSHTKHGKSPKVDLDKNDVTFVVTPSKHRQLFPAEHEPVVSSRSFSGLQSFKVSSPRNTALSSLQSDGHENSGNGAVRPSILYMNKRQGSVRGNTSTQQFGDDVEPESDSRTRESAGQSFKRSTVSQQLKRGDLDDDESIVNPPRGIFGHNPDYKSDSSINGPSSEGSTKRRVLLTKKGREQRNQLVSDSNTDSAGGGGRPSFSRLQRSFGVLDSKRKRRLSTVIANTAEKQKSIVEQGTEISVNKNVISHLSDTSSPRQQEVRGTPKPDVYSTAGKSSSSECIALIVEYLKEQRGLPPSQQFFQIELNPHAVLVSKLAVSITGQPTAEKLSSRTIPLSDLISADIDQNGTGLMRLWLQLKSSTSPLRVSWTVRAVTGRKGARAWLDRLRALKRREQDEQDLRLLL